ncbi:MAG TPA: 16S rRNA (adenine(1518)-N(6)/adenine(1519)-N(6))-dimethyltransferase RsmA [Actinomycetota bacterium]|nr:16S rRNA (adenine(1518)-N(6)/adenine(1519)-N(6))-dimethyltransferase RsmA [Actinomycetota bacterium]
MSSELLGGREVRSLLRRHGVSPKSSLGQNFVVDPNTIRKVIAVARLEPNDRVLEIGAGCGSLTVGLASAAAHVEALEIDRRLLPALAETVGTHANVTVHQGDALQLDLATFDANVVVANLPYNIAATVVLRILESAPQISRVVVMTQREVAERLAATPGSRVYGQTSVLVAYFGRAAVAGTVGRGSFFPVPAVDSALVRIVRHDVSGSIEHAALVRVVRAAFAQRRKTLRNSLTVLAGSAEQAEVALARAGIDPGARPEDVDLDGFVAIGRELG